MVKKPKKGEDGPAKKPKVQTKPLSGSGATVEEAQRKLDAAKRRWATWNIVRTKEDYWYTDHKVSSSIDKKGKTIYTCTETVNFRVYKR